MNFHTPKSLRGHNKCSDKYTSLSILCFCCNKYFTISLVSHTVYAYNKMI